MKSSNRYQAIPGQTGIRKDLHNNRYEAYKTVNGKRYSQYFSRIPDARNWRLTFVPTEEKIATKSLTMKELISEYKINHLSRQALSTQ